MLLALALLLAQAAATDGGVPASDLEKELQQAISADQSAKAQNSAPGQTAPAGGGDAANGGSSTAVMPGRSSQSMNPDLSVILDADFGYQRRALSFLNGEDPDLKAAPDRHALGFTAQELEIAFSSIVDPFFKAEAYVIVSNLSEFEVEEAFAVTTSLPWNLQVKMGSFRSAFGRQNGQHMHVQDFTRRTLLNAPFFGVDGLRGPGLEVSWLAPLPFFLTLYAEAYTLRRDAAVVTEGGQTLPPAVESFGGDASGVPTGVGVAKAFFPLSDEWSLAVGASSAIGQSPGLFTGEGADLRRLGAGRRSVLLGSDVYLKWKPPNVAGGYLSFAVQAEGIVRHLAEGDGLESSWDGGFYAQLVAQLARRWSAGARYDLIGAPSSPILPQVERYSASVTYTASEFARVRAYLEYERGNLNYGGSAVQPGALYPALRPAGAPAAFLQLEISIGAHGAHPF